MFPRGAGMKVGLGNLPHELAGGRTALSIVARLLGPTIRGLPRRCSVLRSLRTLHKHPRWGKGGAPPPVTNVPTLVTLSLLYFDLLFFSYLALIHFTIYFNFTFSTIYLYFN